MTTAIAQDRLSARFNLWDTNGDGQLDRDDFVAEGRRIVQAFGESETSPRGSAVMTGYNDLWDYIADQAGVTGGLTREQFERVGAEVVGDGAAGWAAVVRPHITAILQLCDTDGDGQISQAEFSKWLKAMGAEGKPADVFKKIDTNNDGYLSVEELGAAVQAYSAGTLDVAILGR